MGTANRTKKETAAVSLAAGMTHRETAESAGIAKSTLSRWLDNDSDFLDQLAQHRNVVRDHLHGRLVGVAGEAFATLLDLMRTSESDAVRVRCALALMDRASDLDLEARVNSIETQLAAIERAT